MESEPESELDPEPIADWATTATTTNVYRQAGSAHRGGEGKRRASLAFAYLCMQLAIAIFSVRLSTPSAVKCICRRCDKAGKALNINCMPMCHNFTACTRITTRAERGTYATAAAAAALTRTHMHTLTPTLFRLSPPCGVFYFLHSQLHLCSTSPSLNCLPHSLNNQFHAVALGSILLHILVAVVVVVVLFSHYACLSSFLIPCCRNTD